MRIYADNAATTKMSPTAIAAMLPYLTEHYGNPSSLHTIGQQANEALEGARTTVAQCINARPDEIYFTSGGSEADNQAIRSAAKNGARQGKKHIISTAFEHHAVLHTLEALAKEGFEVTLLDVHEDGVVTPEEVAAAIREDTCLVTVMYANNEIGSIQPIPEIGALCKERKIPFHTDAVQAVGHLAIDVKAQNIDMLSLSGHKFGGPRGIGALYMRKPLRLPPLIHGGGQEKGRRSGTENVAGAAGMAAALKESVARLEDESARLTALRDRLIQGLSQIPCSRLTGDPVNRLPGTASFVFEGVEGEALLLHLDAKGICASSGSACSSASLDPSHVLLSIGLPHAVAHGSLRLSLGADNTEADVDYLLKEVPAVVSYLREMSPVWDKATQRPTWDLTT